MAWRQLRPHLGIVMGLAASLGCWKNSSEVVVSGGDAATDPGLDAGADQGPCRGSYLLPSGGCARPLSVIRRSPLALAPLRDHHTTSVVETTAGPFLYVVGGTEAFKIIYRDVLRSPIQPDGSLGPFVNVATMPRERAGHCTVFAAGKMFVIGGTPDYSTLIAAFKPDGSIGPFTVGPPLSIGRHHAQCEVVGTTIYVLGGRGEDGQSRDVTERTEIKPDGTLSPFTSLTPLPETRSHHQSIVEGRRIYLLGGLTGDPAKDPFYRDDVISADIAADGSLGPWDRRGTMPVRLSVAATQRFEDAVYILGGLYWDSGETDQVLRVRFAPDGSLTFKTLDVRLSVRRGHVHQTPIWKNFIYSLGGKLDVDHSNGIIDIGEFTAPPPLTP